jgi:hypothetical protein
MLKLVSHRRDKTISAKEGNSGQISNSSLYTALPSERLAVSKQSGIQQCGVEVWLRERKARSSPDAKLAIFHL